MTVFAIKTRVDTNKFAQTKAFYADILGLQVLKEWDKGDDAGTIFGFSTEGSNGFLEIGRAETPAAGFEALSLQFRVPDIQAVAKSLEGKWPHRGPVQRPWGAVYIYLNDPNDIRVIVYQEDD